jgi:shikimate dehydrogenase
VVFILNWLRAESVVVAGRDNQKTCRLAGHFNCMQRSLKDLADFPIDVDLIVNATSISSRDESIELTGVVDGIKSNGCQLVFDLNYGHRENIWQTLAEKSGIRFMDGLSALAYQARRTFLLWTGQDVPQEEFLKALEK